MSGMLSEAGPRDLDAHLARRLELAGGRAVRLPDEDHRPARPAKVRQIALQISADEAEVVVWIGSSQMIIGDLKRNAAAADCQESRLLVPGAMVAIARFMDASLG